jgi:PAS domain S-box-containing protein
MTPPERPHTPLLSRTRALLPFSLVFLSLLSLAGLHLLATHKTGSLRNRIATVVEPSRTLVTEIQSAIALESAAARGYLLAGDAQSAGIRVSAKLARASALSRLQLLAGDMGPEVARRMSELSANLRPGDLLIDSLLAGRLSRESYVSKLADDHARLRRVLTSTSDLDNAIADEATRSLSDIHTIERISAVLTALFVAMALLAALLVERLARSYRVLLEELTGSEERFRQIVEAIRDFIWLSDSNFTRHFYANAAYERIWGRPRQRLYENPYALLDGVHPEDVSRVSDALSGLPHGEYDIEFRVIRPDGDQRWVWSRGFPVRDESGQVYRVAGITEDITERKLAEAERERLLQREREIRTASDEARAAAEARREEVERVTASRTRLIRGFTHDVKNPLGAADGFLALLQDEILGKLTPKQLESIGRVRRSIGAALGLIGYLLDLARAEAGQLEIRRKVLDLGATATEVSEDFRAEAEAKQLTMTLEDTGPEPLAVCSDHARVRQVLSNLVSNAVKYTPPGGNIRIRVESRLKPGADDEEWIATDVADNGPGISAAQLPRLFDEFARFDPGAAQGSGIGLAISERVAGALGGSISVISKPGAGSTFTLWLPANAQPIKKSGD